MTTNGHKPREQTAAQLARELITFADGLEDAGQRLTASKLRNVARETIWLADELDTERGARQAFQERCEQQQAIFARGAYDALLNAARESRNA